MTQSISRPTSATKAYNGYVEPHRGASDELLVRTGRGTACGEYLRRYWQPVALAAEIEDVPRLIRVLGEELVISGTGLVAMAWYTGIAPIGVPRSNLRAANRSVFAVATMDGYSMLTAGFWRYRGNPTVLLN